MNRERFRTDQAVGTITCGDFTAMPRHDGRWEFTCATVPDWREIQDCNKRQVRAAVIELQQRNRRGEIAA